MRQLFLITALLWAALLHGQTAVYGTGSTATDQDLLVAKDRSSSTLSTSINNSTLTVVVASGTSFAAKEVITIDSEQMQICSISTNTFTICTGTRGFGGTSAASHTSGVTVKGNVTAYHHNALKEEIKAIEAAPIYPCTISSGSISCPGGISTGTSGGVAGAIDITQGTLPTFSLPNTFTLYGPTSISSAYQWKLPAADAAGVIVSDGAATPGTLSIVGTTGTGSFMRAGSPTATGTAIFNNITVNGTCTGCTGSGSGTGSQRGAFSSRPSPCDASVSGQTYYATDSPGVFSQCNSSTWFDFAFDSPVTLPPSSGSFTTVNGGTLAQSGATLYYTKSTSGLGVNLISMPSPSSSWDVQMSGRLYMTTANQECGLWVTQGTTAGSHNAYGIAVTNSAGTPLGFQRNYVPTNGSIGDTGAISVPLGATGIPFWFRLTKSGTTITSYTGDGTTWNALSTFTASSLTHYGFGCDPRGSSTVGIKVYHLLIQ